MKKMFFVSVSFAVISILTAGCASAPKAQRFPVYIETNAPPTNASPYKFSQEPAKRVIEDDGREYQTHVRELQRQRLSHERQLAAIEQAAQEASLAKERGVNLQPPASQPQPQAAAPVQQQSVGGAIYPTGYPYPGGSGSAIYPTGYPYPSGGGGFGGCGNGFGSVPITRGTFRSTVRADWGPVQSGVLGKAFRFLTQSEDFPGYRQTGGPATIVRTYSAGGEVVAGGGFTSGLSFGWRR